MESKDLLVPDPLLYDNSLKKYIWISDCSEDHKNAQYLFGYLMRNHIYMDGFATNSVALADLEMYHKRICDMDSLQEKNAIVFYDIWYGDIWKTYDERGHRARIINPDLGKEKIVIWGSGITGEKVFKLLKENEIKVSFFVDSNKSLIGTIKCGLPVCSPNVLMEDFVIIEAMEQWKELDEEIQTQYPKRFHYSLKVNWDKIIYNLDGIKKKVFSLSDYWIWCSRFIGKRIYIYGMGGIERAFADCLKLLDYDFAGFLADDEADLMNTALPIKVVEDILYEENYYIWVYDKHKNRKLKELGLRHFFEYEYAMHFYGIISDTEFCLDVNLGHSYFSGSKYPGIEVYGDEEKADYKIAVLGASTTEGVEFPFKSWPEIFYEELGCKNLVLYNGGVSGYRLGQLLIKLIRDILPLKPDMLIVYDGYIELYEDVQHPFAFSYLRTIFGYAEAHMEKDMFEDSERTASLGIDSGRDSYENWLFCLRNMNAIAKENNIKFYYVCQPWLTSKRGKTIQEKNMLLSMPSGTSGEAQRTKFRDFLSANKSLLPGYVYDLSNIFDYETDVYMDVSHVWEKGNRMIAREIAKVVSDEIGIWKGKQNP